MDNKSDKFEVRRIGVARLNKLRKRSNNICIYCGEELPKHNRNTEDYNKFTVEHIVPRSVFKWVDREMGNNIDLGELCNDDANLALVHYKCNYYKNSKIPVIETIQHYKCRKELQQIYLDYLKRVKIYIIEYKKILKNLLCKQEYKCYCCERKIDTETANIRRLNNRQDRVIENAVVVCGKCNARFRKLIGDNKNDN